MVEVIGLAEGECELDKRIGRIFGEPKAAPPPFAAACKLIEKLKRDPRARPWKPRRLRITFRTALPGDKRVSLGPNGKQWPSSIPKPKGGFRKGKFSEDYDGRFLKDFESLVGSPHGAQLVEVDGWKGYVDYENVIPGDDGRHFPGP